MIAPGQFHTLAVSYPIQGMATVQNTRHQRLQQLIAQAGSVQALADKLGKSHSQISQLRNQVTHSSTGRPRTVGDGLAREIEEKLALPVGWMDNADSDTPAFEGVAHDMSQARPILDLPKLAWEKLDMGQKPDQAFELEVIDGAFGAEIPAGCVMRMDPGRAPRAGWPVLVRDRHGKHYLRDYQQAAGGRWQAVARTRGFAPMDSEDDGLQVIAVMKGVDWP